MLPEEKKKYTYADLQTWDDGNRYELIDGAAYMLASPSINHQRILKRLAFQLELYLDGKACEALPAPLDVRLNAGQADDTVVQPDLIVVCDPQKLENGKTCKGAPDMIVEILSPSTARRDLLLKYNQYREAGVREYWIVNPEERLVDVHTLENGKYVGQPYGDTDTIPVHILEDCRIDLTKVFPPLPPEEFVHTNITPG